MTFMQEDLSELVSDEFILSCCIFVFNDLYFIDLVAVYLVFVLTWVYCMLVFFRALILIFSAKRFRWEERL